MGRHVEHAEAFVAAVGVPDGPVLDLGSGGGVPGLVLADRWPSAEVVLLDARARRTAFLAEVVAELGWTGRVRVETGRAEILGRRSDLRHGMAAVAARSFGPPSTVAECGAPFLRTGGVLVVAEPPGAEGGRWPADGLALLGLVDEGPLRAGEATVRRLRAAQRCGPRYPRANGVPRGAPLF